MIKPSCDRVNEQAWLLKYYSMLGGNEGHQNGNAFRKQSFPSKVQSAEKKKRVNYILVTVIHLQSLPSAVF